MMDNIPAIAFIRVRSSPCCTRKDSRDKSSRGSPVGIAVYAEHHPPRGADEWRFFRNANRRLWKRLGKNCKNPDL